MANPLDRLRHHVSGAIARGEAQPITAVETRYEFDFISNYQGKTDYALYANGKLQEWRISTQGNVLFRSHLAPPVTPEILQAFNDMVRARHSETLAKHGPDLVSPFIPYVLKSEA